MIGGHLAQRSLQQQGGADHHRQVLHYGPLSESPPLYFSRDLRASILTLSPLSLPLPEPSPPGHARAPAGCGDSAGLSVAIGHQHEGQGPQFSPGSAAHVRCDLGLSLPSLCPPTHL